MDSAVRKPDFVGCKGTYQSAHLCSLNSDSVTRFLDSSIHNFAKCKIHYSS